MKHSTYMQDDIDNILGEIASKDSQVLCREMLSIGDTMDVLRSKWTVEILTAIRFKQIGRITGECVAGYDETAMGTRYRKKC